MTGRRLILHAGLHKTGTTALQNALFANRELLLEQGVFYPDVEAISGRRHDAHVLFAHAVAGASDFDLDAFIQSLLATPSDHTVLISAEAVSRHFDGASHSKRHGAGHWSAGGDGPDYWARRKSYLEKLRNVLSEFDVLPVLTLRRQDKVAESLYFSFVFSLGVSDDFRTFLIGRRHWFDFDAQIALFREVFGQIETITYEESVREGVAESFLHRILGIELAGLNTPRLRVSTDPRTVLWMRKRNAEEQDGLKAWRRRVFGFGDWLAARAPFADLPKVGFWRSQEERDRFLRTFGIEGADQVRPLARLDSETEREISSLFDAWEKSKS